MATLIFSHGNSFGASTYRTMLTALEQKGHTVHAIERYGHDERYPVSDNWPHLVQELHDFAAPIVVQLAQAGQPAPVMLGHSLGGLLSTLTASRYPQLARMVVALDSPIVSGWRALVLRWGKRSPWRYRVPPMSVAKNRREWWPDVAAVSTHFGEKSVFAKWHPDCLRDYITHGTVDVVNWADEDRIIKRTLAFRRAVEAEIYATLPDNGAGQLRRQPLACPFHFISGAQSVEMRQAGDAVVRKLCAQAGNSWRVVQGDHLFPMQRPHETAAWVHELVA